MHISNYTTYLMSEPGSYDYSYLFHLKSPKKQFPVFLCIQLEYNLHSWQEHGMTFKMLTVPFLKHRTQV